MVPTTRSLSATPWSKETHPSYNVPGIYNEELPVHEEADATPTPYKEQIITSWAP